MSRATNYAVKPSSFISTIIQLSLVFAVIWLYNLEQITGFFHLIPIILGGFVIHSFLPARFRPLFFLIVSVAGILVVIPPPSGLAIIAIGLLFIGVCHLPINYWVRVTLLILMGAGFAVIRIGTFETGYLTYKFCSW